MQRTSRVAGVLATAMLLVFAGTACASLAISIQPPMSHPSVGDTISLAVHAEGSDSVGWYWVRIVTDPSVVAYYSSSTNILNNCRMGSNCMQCGPTGVPGVFEADCACFGTHTCVGVPGDLVIIRYIVGGQGTSSVSFGFAYASDCNRNMITLNSVENGAVIVGAASVEGDPTLGSTIDSFSCHPNPSFGGVTLEYWISGVRGGANPGNAVTEIRIYDCQGRLVRRIEASLSPGEHSLQWDGSEDDGGLVPPGTYFCRLLVNGEMRMYKILKVR